MQQASEVLPYTTRGFLAVVMPAVQVTAVQRGRSIQQTSSVFPTVLYAAVFSILLATVQVC